MNDRQRMRFLRLSAVALALLIVCAGAASSRAGGGAAVRWLWLVDRPVGVAIRYPPSWHAEASAQAGQLVVASYRLPAGAADSPEPLRMPANGAFVALFVSPASLVLPRVRSAYPSRPRRISFADGRRGLFEGFGPGIMFRFRDRDYTVDARVALGARADAGARANVLEVLNSIRLTPLARRERTIPVGSAPTDVAYGDRSVWVSQGRFLLRLDPRTGHVEARIPIPPGGDYRQLALGLGGVWISDGAGPHASLVEVDPSRERVRRRLALRCCAIGVAVGAGSLWVARPKEGRGEVLRIEPRRERVTARIPVGVGPGPIVFAGGSVWVANTSQETSLMRIDPATDKVVATVEVGRSVSDLALGASGLWAMERTRDRAVQVDAKSGRVLRRVALPDSGQLLAVGRSELWAASRLCRNCAQSFVSRLPLSTGLAGPPLPVGRTAVAAAVGGGALWVANFGSSTVTRIALRALRG